MSLFSKIDGAAIVRNRGVYRNAELAIQHGSTELYAKVGSGYVKLNPRGNCSMPSMRWDRIEGIKYSEDALHLRVTGRLCSTLNWRRDMRGVNTRLQNAKKRAQRIALMAGHRTSPPGSTNGA